jgi:HlyD family secretion protein
LAARQFQATREKAQAELAQALGEARQAKERQAADVRLAQVEMEAAQDEESRARRLAASRVVAPAERVKVAARLREAQEKLQRARLPVDEGRAEVLRQALAVVERDYAVRREELAMKRAGKQGEVEAARMELANLELERKQAVIRAPMDGVVTAGDVKVGDLLEPGKAVAEVAQQKGFRFEALVPSEEVGHLRVGMPARVKPDAYDYQSYGTLSGTVCYVSPDSGVPDGQRAAFYVVRVELDGDEVGRGELRGRVKLGMAGQVEVVTERESLLAILVKKIRRTISLG